MRRAVVVALVALVFAGCGGGSDPEPQAQQPAQEQTTTEELETTTAEQAALTHDEFVAKLDAWCKRGNAEVERRWGAAFEEATSANDYERLADVLQERQDWVEEEAEEIPVQEKDLSAQDAQQFRRYLTLSDRIDGLLDRAIAALRTEDTEEITRLFALLREARDDRTTQSVDMGLSECGS